MHLSATEIAALQTDLTVRWHQTTPAAEDHGLTLLVQQNHLRNFQLWHEEDVARRDDLGFEAVYRAKRSIDRFNQERNNFAEEMDNFFVAALNPPTSGCPLNSETPGMMIDRLSILALKEFHMAEETVRADASAEHRQKCRGKLERIRQQRADLTRCVTALFEDVEARRRSFSVYFQFKMYNDPTLNPQLYRKASAS
ncbi:MAG: DUF4254 domain-containing protein [Opitutus sp.]